MPPEINSETRFQGLPISAGVAYGRTCLFGRGQHEDVPDYRVSGEAIETERRRLDLTVATVVQQLGDVTRAVGERVGQAEAGIFAVQQMILQDPVLVARMEEAIESGYNAEAAILQTLGAYEARLREVDSTIHSQRAGDLGELKRRLLDALGHQTAAFECANEPHCRRGRNRIVITEELTPGLALELDAEQTLAVVTDHGGLTSHAAILARALGIPAVSGIPHVHELVACGTEVIVNGNTGEVIVWPAAETVASLRPGAKVPSRPVAAEPVEALRVMANINTAEEVRLARAMKAEGIGLYRTEMEFYSAGRLLDEDEQFERYVAVLRAMDGQPVYFRLLDVGGDKPGPWFDLPAEENPSLGLRGMRYLLRRPDLLRTQARALLRASVHGLVHVMYPMIVDLAQFRRARRVFDEATADLPNGEIRHGVMFEVPSAVLEAGALLAEADFASVGSNDLVQYLFAVDRNNDHVAEDYYPDREVFWHLLEGLVRAAEEAGRPLAICGELAADPKYMPRLLTLGLRTVSVSSRLIPGVRAAAREAIAGRKQA